MSAVLNNDVDLVKRLLANGADAKATSNYGYTALMIAAKNGNNEMVEILLPKSDVKAADTYGYTALPLCGLQKMETISWWRFCFPSLTSKLPLRMDTLP